MLRSAALKSGRKDGTRAFPNFIDVPEYQSASEKRLLPEILIYELVTVALLVNIVIMFLSSMFMYSSIDKR